MITRDLNFCDKHWMQGKSAEIDLTNGGWGLVCLLCHPNFIKDNEKILIWLGLRSRCCGASKEYRLGWSWKQDGDYCTACDRRA